MTKITIDIHSKGDEWPEEEVNALKGWLESEGYKNTVEGSGTNAVNIKGRGKNGGP